MPIWKRGVDLAVTLAVLPVLAVATLLATILLRIYSPGPVFFRQERIGHLGRKFRIYKFRTMHVNADTGVHKDHFRTLVGSNVPMTKMDVRGDSRLIPGGWLLRASGLDELPQLINVLRGEMSLIGPRPCIPYEYDQYLPWQRKRFMAVPGLTGLWQVSGKNRTTFEEMVRLDIQYAEEKSLWLDLSIVLRTVPTLLGQIGETRQRRRVHAPVHVAAPAYRVEPAKPFYTRELS
jgi:lipopolysaccharide/colanic/teichoic acid biosynthesis glycosyltransferase